jgi:hypothetical protein
MPEDRNDEACCVKCCLLVRIFMLTSFIHICVILKLKKALFFRVHRRNCYSRESSCFHSTRRIQRIALPSLPPLDARTGTMSQMLSGFIKFVILFLFK